MKSKLKDALKESTLTLPKILVTVLAAITVSFVSSRLTGYFNTLILAGIIATIAAISSEIYRIVLAIIKVDDLSDKLVSVSTDLLNIKKSSNSESSNDEQMSSEVDETVSKETKNTLLRKITGKLATYLRLSLIFVVIFFISLGANFVITKYTGSSKVVEKTTVIEKPIETKIVETEKIVEKPTILAPSVTPEPSQSPTSTVIVREMTSPDLVSVESRVADLIKRIDELENVNKELNSKVATLESIIAGFDNSSSSGSAIEPTVPTAPTQAAVESDPNNASGTGN